MKRTRLVWLLPFAAVLVMLIAHAASAVPAVTAASGPKLKGPVGLQLYSLRDQLAKDVPGTLDKIKGFGVENVELAGTYGLAPEKFKAALDARGLKAVSAHFPYDRFRTDLDGVIREAKALGIEYVGASWISHNDKLPFDEKTCRAAIAVFNQAGEALAKQGLKFFYHVHGYEFQPFKQGNFLDLMMAETNPRLVNFQMDVFWIVHGGQDPVKLLEKYRGRWSLMHLKGMKDSTPTGFFTGHSDVTNSVPLGTGKIAYPPILRAAGAAGVKWYFLEDESPMAEKQIPKSLQYLSTVVVGDPAVTDQPPGQSPALSTTGLGAFSGSGDVGKVLKAGSAKFDPAKGTYVVAGGGENMWSGSDAFHFVWKQTSGDLTLSADIAWIGTSPERHRKAALIVRQSLDPDSPYADVVLHGDGLASLQYRDTPGGPTREIQSNIAAPGRLRLEKRGGAVSMSVGTSPKESLRPTGGSFRIQFKEPFYVGLAVSAHQANGLEQATFSNVELLAKAPGTVAAGTKPQIASTLEIITVDSMDRRVVHHTPLHIEAPNWSRDGQYLLFNRGGRICKLPVAVGGAGGGEPQILDTGFATKCNNDHGISPDEKLLAISDQSEPDNKSRIYVLPITGGTPRKVTSKAPSYWHGWSPDGKTLAYCAERAGQYDIYTIPVEGGDEKRLTTTPGLDDGPDYSPDGQYIYFNSERTGLMQIWRMKPDGSQQEQVTRDDANNWFAHPSPDGKWIVFLTYAKDVKGHPENQDVALRLMPVGPTAGGGQIQVLAKLFGGQGTINVPSWSPDSKRIAFVSYQQVYP